MTKRIDWNAQPLGIVSDRRVAEACSVSVAQVRNARAKAGIAPRRGRALAKAVSELGSAPDRVVAIRNCVDVSYLVKLRKRLGMPTWDNARTCPCGNGYAAFQNNQRFCSYECQRYYWQLTKKKNIPEDAANCALALWRFKRTLKGKDKPNVEEL